MWMTLNGVMACYDRSSVGLCPVGIRAYFTHTVCNRNVAQGLWQYIVHGDIRGVGPKRVHWIENVTYWPRISRKWCKIRCKFVLFTNRKWYVGFLLVPKSASLHYTDVPVSGITLRFLVTYLRACLWVSNYMLCTFPVRLQMASVMHKG